MSEGSTTLDLPYEQLPEWLSARSITATHWLRQLKKVRVAIEKATPALLQHLALLPDKAPLSLLVRRCCLPTMADPSGQSTFATHCLYVDAKAILHCLTTPNAATPTTPPALDTTKSFLGYYKHAMLAAWDDIVRSYESGALHLAEAARAMVQDCKYEVGALRKTQASNATRIGDIERRIAALARGKQDSEKDYWHEYVRLQLNDPTKYEEEVEGRVAMDVYRVRERLQARTGELVGKFAAIHRRIQAPE